MNIGSISRTYDGRVALRFERAFPHSPEQVWRVITDPEYLQVWFPATVDLELTPGTPLEFRTSDAQIRRLGLPEGHTTSGTILVVRPGHVLEYLWDSDVLHWELAPDGRGGCWLTLTHTTDDEDDALAHGAGWHAGFEVVEAQLEQRPVDWSPWDRAAELAEHYRSSSE
ncbi:SRPBCC family protein [Rhodococcus chondri]|uniref:SRPBCC family protein n=1 Tax=Rhodococcus chondri TaxID=3065941 RepID=A0ABU7JVA1_9NOCA|nr:SRPBCC family protein [Rhodococcus sp. CC-R104]MEE2033958.1 SRPBCC family protein [Rhodococcus sp. CC-R104]